MKRDDQQTVKSREWLVSAISWAVLFLLWRGEPGTFAAATRTFAAVLAIAGYAISGYYAGWALLRSIRRLIGGGKVR